VKIAAPPQQAHLVPGYRLDGRYELLYPYAQGGMAIVWVARVQGKHGFEKLVAVKTILPNLASDQGFRTMFLDEASIASRIRHPNVADIVDLGEEAQTLYMVLEWVSGDAWSKLYTAVSQAGHAFPAHILLRIAADACAGLHAAHELRDDVGGLLNVIHRDVSPQNILITTAGVTKVIDFGIAKAMDRMAEETKTGLLKGKAQYTAPEQVRRGGVVDRRIDLWAIGTILYHYLSGRLPYEGKSDLETLKALTIGKPPPPLPGFVPPQIAQVVMGALTPSPDARFQTALDMQRAIESVMPQPTTATDVSAFMVNYLAERLETKRKDLADALAESEERSGKPKRQRMRHGSFPELARPAILDQVLGTGASQPSPFAPGTGASQPSPFAPGTGMPQPSPFVPGTGMPQPSPVAQRGSQPPFAAPSTVPPPAAAPPRQAEVDDAIPTRMRGVSALRPTHWLLLCVGAAVPLVVWGLVAYVAINGPLGRPRAPASPAQPPAAASAGPAEGGR
jgi:eukaryotic-like serine/threonine-protein kinase